MITKQVRLSARRDVFTRALSLACVLFMSACGGALPAPIGAGSTSASRATTEAGKPTPDAPVNSQAQQATSSLDCTALFKANQGFGTSLAVLINLTSDTSYAGLTDPASPVYLDFAKLRGDLNTLATLPDPTDPAELLFGKPSESVGYFRQVVDVGESDVKTQGKPFKDTNATGQKVLGLDSTWMKEYTSFGPAIDKACPGFTLPTDIPASTQATNQVGQTAALGDLQVTLDKVVTVPGEGAILPDPGSRFVFISIIIENTGKTALSSYSVAASSLQDAAGKQYGRGMNAMMLSAYRDLNGEVAPGAKTSGTIGYQLPTNVGDLVWIVTDNAAHRAVFAIKASDIVVMH